MKTWDWIDQNETTNECRHKQELKAFREKPSQKDENWLNITLLPTSMVFGDPLQRGGETFAGTETPDSRQCWRDLWKQKHGQSRGRGVKQGVSWRFMAFQGVSEVLWCFDVMLGSFRISDVESQGYCCAFASPIWIEPEIL